MNRRTAALALALVVAPATAATSERLEGDEREQARAAIIMQLQATTSRECDSIRRRLGRETDAERRALLTRAKNACEKALARLRDWERGNVAAALDEAGAAMDEPIRLVLAYEREKEIPDHAGSERPTATKTAE